MTQTNSIQPENGTAAPTPSGYRLQIDGIRALAVLLVIVGHYAPTKARFTPGGGIGVRVFFVISGFLITGILLSCLEKSRKADQSLWLTLRQFYLRRVLRIFPAYYAALIVAFAVGIGAWSEFWPWLVGFAGNWYMAVNDTGMGAYSAYWSVAVEEQFYMVWPFLILFLPAKRIPQLCWGIVVGVASCRLIAAAAGVPSMLLYVSTLTSMDALAIGALLANYEFNNQHRKYERLCKFGFYVGMPSFLAIYAWRITGKPLPPVLAQYYYVAGALVGVWMVGRAAKDSNWMLAGLFKNPAVRYLGQISYGLYLYHMLVFAMAVTVFQYFSIPWDRMEILRVAGITAVALAVSMASYHWFELPIVRHKDRFPYIVRTPENSQQPSEQTAAAGPPQSTDRRAA